MNLKNLLKLLALLFMATVSFTACDDEEDDSNDPTDETTADFKKKSGIYILNQGVYGSNNASISFLDYSSNTMYNNVFEAANERKLGDTGQDGIVYGSKMYIVVNGSNTIEIVDSKTCKSIKSLQSTIATSPRDVIAYNGKIYISMYDGQVARLDTTTLEYDKFVKVGPNPEEMAVANDFLYVVNSDGLNYNNGYTDGKSVSKINLATFTEVKKISVAVNPTKISADSKGNVIVLSMGNYADVPATLQKITSDDNVVKYNIAATLMTVNDTVLYTINAPWGATKLDCIAISTISGQVINPDFLKGDDIPANPIKIEIDPTNGDILIGAYYSASDFTSNGYFYVFDKTGNFKKKYNVGVGASGFAYLN